MGVHTPPRYEAGSLTELERPTMGHPVPSESPLSTGLFLQGWPSDTGPPSWRQGGCCVTTWVFQALQTECEQLETDTRVELETRALTPEARPRSLLCAE